MKIYSQDGSELMNVTAIEHSGGQLVVKGKIFQSMPMTAKLRPEEARAGMKLMSFSTWLFLVTLPFRKSIKPAK